MKFVVSIGSFFGQRNIFYPHKHPSISLLWKSYYIYNNCDVTEITSFKIVGDDWNFTAWSDNEPDNAENSLYEVCLLATADSEYQWADRQCWLKAKYICSFGE